MPRQGTIVLMVAMIMIATASVICAQDRQLGRRVALVIGNAAYAHTPVLENPRNDAEDLAPALAALGFEVISGADLGKDEMDQSIKTFATTLKGADIGLFFYAGHSLQVDGVNYLVPVDAQLATADALVSETVRLDVIQNVMEKGATTNVLFLDACRDNPLARNLARSPGARGSNIGRGLAPVAADFGTLISYASQPETLALDSKGSRNSPYASALKAHLGREGEELTSNLVKIRNEVMSATSRRQVPWWDQSALTASLYLGAPIQATGSTIRGGDRGGSSGPIQVGEKGLAVPSGEKGPPVQSGEKGPVVKRSGKCKVDPTDWGSCQQ
jgi:uncharacterized caspase-like protein